MIAGDRDDAIGRVQPGQRRKVVGAGADAAVDQIPGDHHQIRMQGIALGDYLLHPGTGEQAAGVDVGELQHAITVERGRQAIDGDLDLTRLGHGHALPDAVGRQQQRQCAGRRTQPCRTQRRPHAPRTHQPRDQQQRVQQQHEYRAQQQRGEAGGEHGDHRLGNFRRRHAPGKLRHDPVVQRQGHHQQAQRDPDRARQPQRPDQAPHQIQRKQTADHTQHRHILEYRWGSQPPIVPDSARRFQCRRS